MLARQAVVNSRHTEILLTSKKSGAVTMDASSTHEVTQLLVAWNGGDQEALAKLVPLVEAELHRLAKLYLSREREGHTLQPTALVNEAYLKLIDWRAVEWKNRAHFIGVAAEMMRRILIDHALRRRRQKRLGQAVMVSLTSAGQESQEPPVDIIALHDALNELAKFDPRKSKVVELRFFGGLTVEETAEVLQISHRTVEREWMMAKTWLFHELSKE
jgi:RNA polymerase sigma factor (TIGR02999 family)